jgi:hypothetical protein|tara:strand:+ start:277 stop:759 length:483 start_codon:yes stop_codon:yes gene_type:complete
MMNFFKDRKRTIYDRTGTVPYLIRWYIFLKDRKSFPFNITLHKILVSDEAVLHDHPWSWGTMILKGGYWEHTPLRAMEGHVVGSTKKWWGPGTVRFRKADDLHWLELEKDKDGNEIPCWSLFYMGKKSKEWGFMRHVKDLGYRWILHTDYLKDKKTDETA